MKPIEPASADKVGSVELNSAERRKLDEEFAFNWATQRTTIRWPIGGRRDVPFRNLLRIVSHIGVNWGDAHQFSGPESVLTWGHLLSSRYQIPCSTAQLIPFRLIGPINQYLARLETVDTPWLRFFSAPLLLWFKLAVLNGDEKWHQRAHWLNVNLPPSSAKLFEQLFCRSWIDIGLTTCCEVDRLWLPKLYQRCEKPIGLRE